MLKNSKVLLCSILLFFIAFGFRIYQVDSSPSGILIDEASIGYNAYSILKTGKDEHGTSFPLLFKAFGDQKLPLYVYLTVPFIKYLDLSVLAIRLPSVIVGSLLPVAIFLLLIELGFKRKIGLFGGVVTAISPWTIILSRFGYESNLGLFLFTIGILFSFIAFRKKAVFYAIVAGVLFGLTLYSYVAYRFITPFMLMVMLFLRINKNRFTKIKVFLISTFLLMILPLSSLLFTNQTIARFSQASLTYNSGMLLEVNENRTYCGEKLPKILCYATSNKLISLARVYIYRYVDVFSPKYLFMTGDTENPSLNVDNFGLFYIWLLPFYILGILVILDRGYAKRLTPIDLFVLLGLLISITPALLVGSPHKVRLSGFFPFMAIILAHGASLLEDSIKNITAKKAAYSIFFFASFLSAVFFLILFLTVHIHKYEAAYRTFVPKLMKYLGQHNPDTQIYISSITEGIIYYSFFNKIDPLFYQKNVKRNFPDSIGFIHSSDLASLHITNEDFFLFGCGQKKMNTNTFYVSHENLRDIPSFAKKIIYSENGVDSLAVIYDFSKLTYKDLRCKE